MSGSVRSRLGLSASGNKSHGILSSAANSCGPSVDGSSLVTEANSCFSGGRQLHSSSSINDESYMHLPASPLSCSNISGSSVMDSSSIVQPSPQKELIPKQVILTSTTQSMIQDVATLHAQKRPRFDLRQGDVHQQEVMQQMLQRHYNLQLQAILQPQQFSQLQQHQLLQPLPQLQRIQMLQTPQIPRPCPPQLMPPVRPPFESGLCARRLMQYMFHQSHRPADNPLFYWRKFVVEYFAPRAKKRWCFALHTSSVLGAFPQASMDTWQCGICGSKSGKGYEATYEVLPRLEQIQFDQDLIDKLLYLDFPQESRFPSGLMVLEYAKAVQESVYEQCRVVQEGKLRVTFTPDLKILCWEFCTRRHEELIPRSKIVHQANQLLHAAHKYKSSLTESGTCEVSFQDLQASCNMFAAISDRLARNVELPILNELGFSKRFVRCLQISEVINSMKDLMDFSQLHKVGPIESLKSFSQQASVMRLAQKRKMEQAVSAPSFTSDSNTLTRLMAMHPRPGTPTGSIYPATFFTKNSSQGAGPLNSYHHLLRRSLPNPGQSFHYIPNKSQPQLDTQTTPHFQYETTHQQPHSGMNDGSGQLSNSALSLKDCVKDTSANQNGSDITTVEVSSEINRATDSKSEEAHNISYNAKDSLFENLNLCDLDQEWLGELIDGIEW